MKKTVALTCLFAGLVQANDFAFKLYDQLRTTPGNLFFSPASIETALAMTREGAAGNTLRQMSLLLPETAGSAAMAALPQTVETDDAQNGVVLESANAIWTDQSFPILGNFQTAVTEQYGADIRAADFQGQPEAERETINGWVEEKTRDKITDLLPPGSVTASSKMILVNAIYFKGDWLRPFDPALTREEPFHSTPQQCVNVPMMTMEPRRLGYMENESFQCLELPYQGEALSMLIVLPKEPGGLERVEEGLSAGAVQDWAAALHHRDVKVFLPKFKIESAFSSLRSTLMDLGLNDAFDPARADFSGISEQPLFISDVVHKAFVQVDEEGTEAAAATGAMMRVTALPAPPTVFRADRPFLFLIRDSETGTVLFTGRICNPLS